VCAVEGREPFYNGLFRRDDESNRQTVHRGDPRLPTRSKRFAISGIEGHVNYEAGPILCVSECARGCSAAVFPGRTGDRQGMNSLVKMRFDNFQHHNGVIAIFRADIHHLAFDKGG
jgi:hypothetical protein